MLAEFGYELVLARLHGARGGQTLTLHIDKPGGVTSDDCAAMVKRTAVLLATLDSARHNYAIVVSSPGPERALTRPADFDRFAGHRAAVTAVGAAGKATQVGILRGVSGGAVMLETDTGTVAIPATELVAAHLVEDWADQ